MASPINQGTGHFARHHSTISLISGLGDIFIFGIVIWCYPEVEEPIEELTVKDTKHRDIEFRTPQTPSSQSCYSPCVLPVGVSEAGLVFPPGSKCV
jgi:hypothetical protein